MGWAGDRGPSRRVWLLQILEWYIWFSLHCCLKPGPSDRLLLILLGSITALQRTGSTATTTTSLLRMGLPDSISRADTWSGSSGGSTYSDLCVPSHLEPSSTTLPTFLSFTQIALYSSSILARLLLQQPQVSLCILMDCVMP